MFRHLGELCSNISHYKRVLSMNKFCIVLHGLCVLTAAVFRLDEVQLFHVNVVGRAEQADTQFQFKVHMICSLPCNFVPITRH